MRHKYTDGSSQEAVLIAALMSHQLLLLEALGFLKPFRLNRHRSVDPVFHSRGQLSSLTQRNILSLPLPGHYFFLAVLPGASRLLPALGWQRVRLVRPSQTFPKFPVIRHASCSNILFLISNDW